MASSASAWVMAALLERRAARVTPADQTGCRGMSVIAPELDRQLRRLALKDQAERDIPALIVACMELRVTKYEEQHLQLAFRAGTKADDRVWKAAAAHLNEPRLRAAAVEARQLGAAFTAAMNGQVLAHEDSLGLIETVVARAAEVRRIGLTCVPDCGMSSPNRRTTAAAAPPIPDAAGGSLDGMGKELDEDVRHRLGYDLSVAVVPSENHINSAGYTGKRLSPDCPGAPGRARWPRWTELLNIQPDTARAALQRLRAQWDSVPLQDGVYAVGYTKACEDCGALSSCAHQPNPVCSEVVVVDPRVPRVLAAVARVDQDGRLLPASWRDYRKTRQAARRVAWRRRAEKSLEATGSEDTRKGVVRLLAEAELLLGQLQMLIDRSRSAERKEQMTELVSQTTTKLKTASAKYKSLA